MSGYEVDPQILKQASKGINQAIHELQDVGGVGDGAVGRGFSDLAMSDLQVGDAGLCKAFSEFAERWEWGVRALVVEGNQVAEKLDLSAGYYHEMEEYGKEIVKDGVLAATGDPGMSEKEVAKTDLSWGSIKDGYTPDFSMESSLKAHEELNKTWQATKEDVTTSGVGGAHVQAVHSLTGEPPSEGPATPSQAAAASQSSDPRLADKASEGRS